jgi:hypothetical protein
VDGAVRTHLRKTQRHVLLTYSALTNASDYVAQAAKRVLTQMHRVSRMSIAFSAYFCAGANKLEKVCGEFDSNGRIAKLTEAERALVASPKVNDHCESLLGRLRILKRRSPSMTELTFNARTMYRDNNTEAFFNSLGEADRASIRLRARRLNESGREKEKSRIISEADEQHARDNRARKARIDSANAARDAKINNFTPNLSVEYWRAVFARPSTVKGDDLEDELRWHTLHNHAILKKAGIDKVIIGGWKPSNWLVCLALLRLWLAQSFS